MAQVKSLDYISTALVYAITYGIVGLVFGLLFILLGSAILSIFHVPAVGSLVGIVGLVIIVIAAVVVGFIAGIIWALLYNFIFSRWVKFSGSVSGAQLTSFDYISAGIVFAVTVAVISFIFGLLGLLSGNIATALIVLISSTIVSLILGFLEGIIFAILYNFIVSRFMKMSVGV